MSELTGIAKQLYSLLPEVYRTRDNEHLQKYLQSYGQVLDQVRALLEQRLADSRPGDPDCQSWLLPYFADLVGVRLVSPDEAGRRDELNHAIEWRQRKGTFGLIPEIVNAIGQYDAPESAEAGQSIVMQEGRRRVACTPRITMPFKVNADQLPLPAATVDLRTSVPPGPNAVPRFPSSSKDAMRRTPDVRAPTKGTGLCHPKRVLIFVRPREGFFPKDWEIRLATYGDLKYSGGEPLEDASIQTLSVVSGRLCMNNCVVKSFTLGSPNVAETTEHVIEDSVIGSLTVSSGRVVLRRCAVETIEHTAKPVGLAAREPVVTMEDCLVSSVRVLAEARFIATTVMGKALVGKFSASDSLFVGDVSSRVSDYQPMFFVNGAFRFCRVPPSVLKVHVTTYRCVDAPPYFFAATFGEPGAGVIDPASGVSICAGAEDGGELGAYHHRRHQSRDRAVMEKLRDYLPAGQSAILLADPCLSERALGIH